MPRVLVTGATGFIGRHLCAALSRRGYTVRAAVRRLLLEALPETTESVAIGELSAATDWSQALHEVDAVIHLAALAHRIGEELPYSTYEVVNALGTEGLALAASRAGIRRLVFVSSIGAVCSMAESTVDEQTPCRPDSAYGKSKRAAEEKVERCLRDTATDYCIIRPTLVYGEGNPGNMIRLLQLIGTGIPLPLGSIRNRRSFVYVENLVDALVVALDHPGASRRIFNLSDGSVLSTPELIRKLAGAMGRRPRLVPCPTSLLRLAGTLLGRRGEVDRLCGSLAIDASSVRRDLGWQAPVASDEALSRTVRWYLANRQRPGR